LGNQKLKTDRAFPNNKTGSIVCDDVKNMSVNTCCNYRR